MKINNLEQSEKTKQFVKEVKNLIDTGIVR